MCGGGGGGGGAACPSLFERQKCIWPLPSAHQVHLAMKHSAIYRSSFPSLFSLFVHAYVSMLMSSVIERVQKTTSVLTDSVVTLVFYDLTTTSKTII